MKGTLVIISLFLVFLLSGCQQAQPPAPNPCANVTCANGGACDNNGACNCANGYWGTNCELTPQEKIYAYGEGNSAAWTPCVGSSLNFNYGILVVSSSGNLQDNNVKVLFLNDNQGGPFVCGNAAFLGTINGNTLTANSVTSCGNQVDSFSFTTNDGCNTTYPMNLL